MKNQSVKISVICPTFNSQDYIERTLNSVFAQIMEPFEIIVSDDGSSDNTIEVVKKLFSSYEGSVICRILENNHSGPGAARNRAIENVASPWIAFIDSDDIWKNNKIAEVVQCIRDNPNVNFICHDEYKLSLKKIKTRLEYSQKYDSSKPIINQLYWSNLFSTSAVTCKYSLLKERGFFNEKLMSIQDYDLWLRLSPIMRVFFINQILGTYIERNGNITSTNRFRRFANEISVIIRHRKKVPFSLFIARIPRVILSHIYQFVKSLMG